MLQVNFRVSVTFTKNKVWSRKLSGWWRLLNMISEGRMRVLLDFSAEDFVWISYVNLQTPQTLVYHHFDVGLVKHIWHVLHLSVVLVLAVVEDLWREITCVYALCPFCSVNNIAFYMSLHCDQPGFQLYAPQLTRQADRLLNLYVDRCFVPKTKANQLNSYMSHLGQSACCACTVVGHMEFFHGSHSSFHRPRLHNDYNCGGNFLSRSVGRSDPNPLGFHACQIQVSLPGQTG